MNPRPMPERYVGITGFVLAGGASRRMGRPKQELPLQGAPMLVRQCRLLARVCRSVAVLGSSSPCLDGIASYLDERPGLGPLGGILTGLGHTRTEYNLFLGCDMPFIPARFLRFLCGRALKGEADVTVAKSVERRVEPLCAVYRRRVRPIVRASLDEGLNQTSGLYARVRCAVISWPEICQAGFMPVIFTNVNTLEQYIRASRAVP